MKKILLSIVLFAITFLSLPGKSFAAAGIYASGGGSKTVGDSFTVTVTASGGTFNALEGTISVSGPVSVTSFSAGSATWITAPANGVHFTGMVSGGTSSLTVATIKLRATGTGSGAVSLSSVKLANSGSVVGTGTGSASYTVSKAPELPGAPTVSSSSHPDQNTAYEATTIDLSWNKASGVDGFSYLLDQSESTTPASSITDANTSITYTNKAVGTYYFHIKAHKTDGWGSTTHYKITIKEPDPKVNESLSKPHDISIKLADTTEDNIDSGTFTGITISGVTEPNYVANITLTPTPTLPEGKTLSVTSDENGNFTYTIDYPISAGYYKLTIQGQDNKVLTPISDEVKFEISLAKGGTINILTDADKITPVTPTLKWYEKSMTIRNVVYIVSAILVLLIIITGATILIKRKIRKNKVRN